VEKLGIWRVGLFRLGTCESALCIGIKSRIESAVTVQRNTNRIGRSVINN